jgi:hypothetical protein
MKLTIDSHAMSGSAGRRATTIAQAVRAYVGATLEGDAVMRIGYARRIAKLCERAGREAEAIYYGELATVLEAAPRCGVHPGRHARLVCNNCGTALCRRCLATVIVAEGCPACHGPMREVGP